MSKLKHAFLPIVVVVVGVVAGVVLMATGPDVKLRPPAPLLPVVETMVVQLQSYQVLLRTQGTVTPRTQSTLIPEVAGRIVSISANFRNGGAFATGETLLTIAPGDYENAITIARADLARARLALEQQKALAKNALDNWKKLGRKQRPTDLTLLKPQVASAKAEVAAAEARLQQAKTNLARTKIRAPYTGRVLEKKVDVGQYVSPGTVAATIYAVDVAEVRLPLTDKQLAFVDLPDSSGKNNKYKAPVTLSRRTGNTTQQWLGQLVRTDGAIDTASRQLFVVAQIDKPFQSVNNTPPLKIGQFVEADIRGKQMQNVFVLPRSAVETGGSVLVITADRKIKRTKVQVALRKGEQVVVSSGLRAGDLISLTPMPFAREGTAVEIASEQKHDREYPPLPVLAH